MEDFLSQGTEALRVKPRRRRQGVSTGLPMNASHRNHVWTWDFVHDTTFRGGTLRMHNVMDEYTRECLCIHVDRRINARKVRRVMARLSEEHGVLEHIRSDNRSEFIERLRRSLKCEDITLNDYRLVPGLEEGVGRWMNDYNHDRIQQGLDYECPWPLYRPNPELAEAA